MRYSRNSEFDDIEAVFRRRSEAAGRQPAPRETGLPPAWDAQSPSAWDQPPAPDQPKPETHEQAMRRLYGTVSDDGVSAPKRRRKKHRFARFLLRLTASLLLLILVFVLASVLLAKMPQTDAPIGVRKDGCAAILICGTDESRARTDTMMLLFIDRKAGRMRVLSLPRDTMVNRDNPVPKLNGAYGANGKGEKGMNVLMDNVRDLIGYRPDGYLLLDLDCFETLVDRMGGVDFNVPVDMYYSDPTQNLYIDLKAGRQRVDGRAAMWIMRYRSGYAAADLKRVSVQRDFLAAALRQWTKPAKLLRAPTVLPLLLKNTETDLNYRGLCWLLLALRGCASHGFESDTLPGEGAWIRGGAYYVEDRAAAAALINEKYNPYEKEITADELHPYGY